ncbi:hypothetical protein DF186_13950 [Enterococcus hirae]|nr:hypothetical protein DF186_13950 [Enterococcus hirae]
MIFIINYFKTEMFFIDEKEVKRLKREVQYYIIINNILYKRGILILLLKCVSIFNIKEVLEEVYSGICGNYFVKKVFRAGFYWLIL